MAPAIEIDPLTKFPNHFFFYTLIYWRACYFCLLIFELIKGVIRLLDQKSVGSTV